MTTVTFGYLRYFGFPYNCERRPSIVQIAIHSILILLFIADMCYVVISEKILFTDLFAYSIVIVMFIVRVLVVVFYLILNLRASTLPLFVKGLDAMQVNCNWRNFNGWLLYASCSIFFKTIIDAISLKKPYLMFIIPLMTMCDVIMYISLAQYVTPLYSITDKMCKIRLFLHSYGLKENLSLTKDTWRLILRQRELEQIFIRLAGDFYFRIMLMVFSSVYGATVAMFFAVGTVGGFIKIDKHNENVMVSFFYSAFYEYFKIWCVAHSTEAVKIEVSLLIKLNSLLSMISYSFF